MRAEGDEVSGTQTQRAAWGIGLLAWVAAIGACVASPRSKSELVQRTDSVAFSGLFEVPGVELEIQAKNQRTQSWVRFASARTHSENPVMGPSGSPYFR